eukprot:gnl/Chilomastix_cuspidata/2696.p1 GENE.gnl/Chilomastix_cuspidata/2696~~gnl/Chilomastix_cuspidata/2696.p1  ORF type:complete len:748 (+),score=395.50 gnl/Chilomastix_cuspidata/2696:89-2332(+)
MFASREDLLAQLRRAAHGGPAAQPGDAPARCVQPAHDSQDESARVSAQTSAPAAPPRPQSGFSERLQERIRGIEGEYSSVIRPQRAASRNSLSAFMPPPDFISVTEHKAEVLRARRVADAEAARRVSADFTARLDEQRRTHEAALREARASAEQARQRLEDERRALNASAALERKRLLDSLREARERDSQASRAAAFQAERMRHETSRVREWEERLRQQELALAKQQRELHQRAELAAETRALKVEAAVAADVARLEAQKAEIDAENRRLAEAQEFYSNLEARAQELAARLGQSVEDNRALAGQNELLRQRAADAEHEAAELKRSNRELFAEVSALRLTVTRLSSELEEAAAATEAARYGESDARASCRDTAEQERARFQLELRRAHAAHAEETARLQQAQERLEGDLLQARGSHEETERQLRTARQDLKKYRELFGRARSALEASQAPAATGAGRVAFHTPARYTARPGGVSASFGAFPRAAALTPAEAVTPSKSALVRKARRLLDEPSISADSPSSPSGDVECPEPPAFEGAHRSPLFTRALTDIPGVPEDDEGQRLIEEMRRSMRTHASSDDAPPAHRPAPGGRAGGAHEKQRSLPNQESSLLRDSHSELSRDRPTARGTSTERHESDASDASSKAARAPSAGHDSLFDSEPRAPAEDPFPDGEDDSRLFSQSSSRGAPSGRYDDTFTIDRAQDASRRASRSEAQTSHAEHSARYTASRQGDRSARSPTGEYIDDFESESFNFD